MKKERKNRIWYLEKLAIYFLVSGFIGWIIENIINFIIYKDFYINILFLPFSVIYGIGAIILGLIFKDDDYEIINILMFGGISLVIYQYLISWIVEKLFYLKPWDYSKIKFNLHGRISLFTTIILSLVAVVSVKYFFPFLAKKFKKLRYKRNFNFCLILLIVIILIDLLVNILI